MSQQRRNKRSGAGRPELPAVSPEYEMMQKNPNYKMARANARIAVSHFELIVGEMRLMKEKIELEMWLDKHSRRERRKTNRHNWKAKNIYIPWEKVKKFFKRKPKAETSTKETSTEEKGNKE